MLPLLEKLTTTCMDNASYHSEVIGIILLQIRRTLNVGFISDHRINAGENLAKRELLDVANRHKRRKKHYVTAMVTIVIKNVDKTPFLTI